VTPARWRAASRTEAWLVEGGLDVARINFSHGSHREHADTIALIRRIATELERPIAILGDLQGPRIRIGELNDPVYIEPGKDVTFVPEDQVRAGDVPVTYSQLAQDVRIGSRVLVDDGNVELTHSISAGLDYASVGPEHAWLREIGRAEYTWIDDEAALAAFQRLGREEGILPALESSHAIAHACRLAPEMAKDAILLVNLSGRGDKDVTSVQAALEGAR